MNWNYLILGLFVTVFTSVVLAVIEKTVPNYDDADEVPSWIVGLIVGAALSFAAGWVFQ